MSSQAVLVVEDEPLIGELLIEALEDEGVAASLATSGDQALEIAAAAGSVQILIMDVNLGRGLNGFEVARRIREIHPNAVVLYLTGDSEKQVGAEGVTGSLLIPKPYLPSEVAARVAELAASGGHS